MNYELRITNCELQIANYDVQCTNYELRITILKIWFLRKKTLMVLRFLLIPRFILFRIVKVG